MRNLPGRLVDDEQVVVFVDGRRAAALRPPAAAAACRSGSSIVRLSPAASAPTTRATRPPVDRDRAGVDQPLNPVACERPGRAEVAQQHAIDANADVAAIDRPESRKLEPLV